MAPVTGIIPFHDRLAIRTEFAYTVGPAPQESEIWMQGKRLPITCPVCGRKKEHPLEALTEGSTLLCPFCKLKLTLHGHMWEDIQAEIAKLKERN